uniref:Putative cleavage stimulating factor 64 n=1 Tax=Davidia involucrata TaxID=16924 RepID=A0A5B6YGA1_DAVIN
MAGKQFAGDGVSASLAGMSKNQLYDIMSQMKTLIEQNQQQARQILIQNPLLTRALFQAQIMLGMVQPPQVIPNIHPAVSQHPQQSAQPAQQSNIQGAQSLSGQVSLQDQTNASQTPNPVRKPLQNQPVMPTSSAAAPPVNLQSQSLPSHPLQSVQQPKGHSTAQASQMSLPQSSQIPSIPPLHSSLQPPSLLQSSMSTALTQMQQPLQTSGIAHLPLQSPLPPQPRPPPVPAFPHQLHSQFGPNAGFQHSGAPQLHYSQPMFHSGTKPPPSMGPSFPQGQLPLPSQLPPQSLYQVGGSQLGMGFNSQIGSSMQADTGSAWMPGLPESTAGTQLPGPPPLVPGQMGPGNQPPRGTPLTPEMEKALIQQVMSLTPEQINLLPPEQRNQVLHLQKMMRH